MATNIICFIIFMFTADVCVGKDYYNYTLYRAIPVNESHIDFFTKLKNTYDVNFWREPSVIHKPIDFVINPVDQSGFLRDAAIRNIYLTTIIDDVEQAFNQQTVKNYVRTDMRSFNWYNYYRLDDIYSWLRDLEQSHPNVVKIQSIGTSHENRDIIGVSIILKGCKSPRSTIIVEGGIHAREWISPAVVTYLIHEILNADSSENEILKEVANSYEWHFVPILNVDGYEYTHTTDRLWRKNRNGHGIDLNRNFDSSFGSEGISWDAQSEIYGGKQAFSEKETRAMASFVTSKSETLKYYVAFHSYGQYIILPYAYSKEHLDDYDEVYKMCEEVATKIKYRYNTAYNIGTAFDTVGYLTSGVSGCWVKKAFKTPVVVTFELRDIGRYGFALPPDLILPTCKETMDGLLHLFDMRRKNALLFQSLPSSEGTFKVSARLILVIYGFFPIFHFTMSVRI